MLLIKLFNWIVDKLTIKGGDKSRWKNSEVRDYWIKRKYRLRFYAGFYFIILFSIGGELATPNYSVSTNLVKNIAPHSTILQFLLLGDSNFYRSYKKEINSTQDIRKKQSLIFKKEIDEGRAGKVVKFFFLTLLFVLFVLHLFSDAPLSNGELLKRLARKSQNSRRSLFDLLLNEIEYYANSLPSEKLPDRCRTCHLRQCTKRLTEQPEEEGNSYWNKIFAELPPGVVDRNLSLLFQCRVVFYLRYGLFVAILFLLPVFLFSQISMLYLKNGSFGGMQLLWYLFILSITFVISGYIFGAYSKAPGGFWIRYRDHVNQLMQSQILLEKFDEIICDPYSYSQDDISDNSNSLTGQELRSIKTLLDYLDGILLEKVRTKISNGKLEQSVNFIKSVYTLLEHIHIFFYSLYDSHPDDFIVLLLEPTIDNEFLRPMLISSQEHIELEKSDRFLLSQHFSRDCDNPSCIAWRDLFPLTANRSLDSYIESKGLYFSSQMAYPIIVDDEMISILTKHGISTDGCVGVLSLYSKKGSTFTPLNKHINESIVRPFSNRIGAELAMNLCRATSQGGNRI